MPEPAVSVRFLKHSTDRRRDEGPQGAQPWFVIDSDTIQTHTTVKSLGKLQPQNGRGYPKDPSGQNLFEPKNMTPKRSHYLIQRHGEIVMEPMQSAGLILNIPPALFNMPLRTPLNVGPRIPAGSGHENMHIKNLQHQGQFIHIPTHQTCPQPIRPDPPRLDLSELLASTWSRRLSKPQSP